MLPGLLISVMASAGGIMLSPLASGLYNAMDSFVVLTPDAISDYVYDVDADGKVEFGRRIIGRPEGLPEKSDGVFPAPLEMLYNAVGAAEKAEIPRNVYRNYQATGGGPTFREKSQAYRMNFKSAVPDYEITGALSEMPSNPGTFTESGAFKLTRDEYVCAQYLFDELRFLGPTKLSDIRALYDSAGKSRKIKENGRTLLVKTVSDPKAQTWRRAYDLFTSHIFANEYIRLYYSRAKRYVYLADKASGKLYIAAYRHGKFYIIETKGKEI